MLGDHTRVNKNQENPKWVKMTDLKHAQTITGAYIKGF